MKNALMKYIDRNPVASVIILPITFMAGAKLFTDLLPGFFGTGLFDDEEQRNGSPIGSYQVRTEGGSADDFTFRATANTAPTKRGTRVGDEIQSRSEGGSVRYDREYHDSIFFPNLDYKDNKQVLSQSYPAKVTDTYVFAGINGISKINMR